MNRINRFIWFLIMIIIGGGVALYYAWYIKPADFVDAALYNMRPDYKTDYVLMIAEIYDKDHNRLQALVRLDKVLAPSDPSRETVVASAIENAQILGYAPVDLEKLYRLQEDISGERATPTPTPVDNSSEEAFTATPSQSDVTVLISTQEPFDTTISIADDDPFGTGIIITTDPNAAPQLNLPPAPMPTANFGGSEYRNDSGSLSLSDDSFWGD